MALLPLKSDFQDPKSRLTHFCHRYCQRQISHGEVEYLTYELGEQYQCIVVLKCIKGNAFPGCIRSNQSDAERSAAEQALKAFSSLTEMVLIPQVKQVLESRYHVKPVPPDMVPEKKRHFDEPPSIATMLKRSPEPETRATSEASAPKSLTSSETSDRTFPVTEMEAVDLMVKEATRADDDGNWRANPKDVRTREVVRPRADDDGDWRLSKRAPLNLKPRSKPVETAAPPAPPAPPAPLPPMQWTEQEVVKWMRLQGGVMATYAESFKAQKVNGVALSKQTTSTLKELGVQALGHRKILAATIATLFE